LRWRHRKIDDTVRLHDQWQLREIALRSLCLVLSLLGLIVADGVRAGTVVLYAATDLQVVEPLIKDFESLHPRIKVVYHDLSSGDAYQRFLDEYEGHNQADVLWSSAMNLQFKLVNDGYAAPYKSAETSALPAWAIWKNEAFGTTFEPIVIVYNKQLVRAADVPRTHAELIRFANEHQAVPHSLVATYDPRDSGLGYLLHTQDLEANPMTFWNFIRPSARAGMLLKPSTAEILDHLDRGDALIGYNVLGSYALNQAPRNANIGIVLPSDYTLILSRIAFINRRAPHPEEARIWMDYLLSRRGQSVLNDTGLFSVRDDVSISSRSASELRQRLGDAFRPIVIGTGLLTYLDRMKRDLFLEKWDSAQSAYAGAARVPKHR
jgi:iron(III) transport system substrate-binding protein